MFAITTAASNPDSEGISLTFEPTAFYSVLFSSAVVVDRTGRIDDPEDIGAIERFADMLPPHRDIVLVDAEDLFDNRAA